MRRKTFQISNKELIEKFCDYTPDESLFSSDDYNTTLLKKIVSQLSKTDYTIILLYAELGSMEAVAKKLNVAASTIFYEIKRIQKHIKGLYAAYSNDNNND